MISQLKSILSKVVRGIHDPGLGVVTTWYQSVVRWNLRLGLWVIRSSLSATRLNSLFELMYGCFCFRRAMAGRKGREARAGSPQWEDNLVEVARALRRMGTSSS